MRYLTPNEVLAIHARIIDETGGTHGVRDTGLLESAVSAPKQSFGGEGVYESIFAKAAALFKKLTQNHPFVDGNKRTAVAAASRFLSLNGYKLKTSQKELVNFTVKVVEDDLDIEDIAGWLEENSE